MTHPGSSLVSPLVSRMLENVSTTGGSFRDPNQRGSGESKERQ